MNFNFGNQNPQTGNAPILNLQKNQVLDLTKHAPTLHKAIFAGGWDAAAYGASADLDISAFMLDEHGRIAGAADVIYFNHKIADGIQLEKDNLTGEGDGDDERIDVDLDKIPSRIHEIVFAIVIFDADVKRQSFGMIKNAFIRLLNAEDNEREVCHIDITNNYSAETAVLACALKRTNDGWSIKNIEEGLIGDLNTIAAKYM